MTENISRQPAGIPVGGQFASQNRSDCELELADSRGNRFPAAPGSCAANAAAIDGAISVRHPDAFIALFDRPRGQLTHSLVQLLRSDGTDIEIPRSTELEIEWDLGDLGSDGNFYLGEWDGEKESGTGNETVLLIGSLQGRLGDPEAASRNVKLAAGRAGLGDVMPGLVDVLIERSSGDPKMIAYIASLDAGDMTEIYEDVAGPALDEIERRFRAALI
jgi:hypothetical protein